MTRNINKLRNEQETTINHIAQIKHGAILLMVIEVAVTLIMVNLTFAPIVMVLNLITIAVFGIIFVMFIISLVNGVAAGLAVTLGAFVIINVAVIIVLFANLYRGLGLDGQVSKPLSLGDCIYFSIVTWTTVGYGDIYPSSEARAVAAFEALSGYLVMGLLVAVIVLVVEKLVPVRMTGGNGTKG